MVLWIGFADTERNDRNIIGYILNIISETNWPNKLQSNHLNRAKPCCKAQINNQSLFDTLGSDSLRISTFLQNFVNAMLQWHPLGLYMPFSYSLKLIPWSLPVWIAFSPPHHTLTTAVLVHPRTSLQCSSQAHSATCRPLNRLPCPDLDLSVHQYDPHLSVILSFFGNF